MPAERIAMRLVREILRLIAVEKLPVREIARMTGKAPSTVRATLGRCRGAGVSWPLPEGLSDAGLEERGGAGLGLDPSGAEAQARNALYPLGRVHRPAAGWPSLFALLRAVQDLRFQAAGGHAPDPRRR